MYVLGNGGPSVSNFKKFSIKWIPKQNGLYNFAYSTRNGVPNYYVDLKSKISQNFGASKPSVSIKNTNIPGFDGDYWVTKSNENFVLVSKNKAYIIYFTNSSKAPSCTGAKNDAAKIAAPGLAVYPNPASSQITFDRLSDTNTIVLISNLQGKVFLKKSLNNTNNTLNINFLKAGMYLVITNSSVASSVKKLYIE